MADHEQPSALEQVRQVLKPGRVYRRADLLAVSTSVDRHLQALVQAGDLRKLAQGLYYAPRKSVFGELPPDDAELVRSFLRDDDFLLFSPSAYNTVGLGTTQLYNRTVVYNRKRHGHFRLGNREFDFRVKPRFPHTLSTEFLFVDLLNNVDELAEDASAVWARAASKFKQLDSNSLNQALRAYGNVTTRKRLEGVSHAAA
ncbi:MAG: hypothetical protein WBJ03_01740 [Moraxellaceae bacterium]